MLIYLILAGVLGFADCELISIEQGLLNGTVLYSRNGEPFHAFYGIPYAAPPIGNLRFMPPQKPLSWNGTRDASKKASVCLQPSNFFSTNVTFDGNEDCLYLSVFTTQIKPETKLPVMVYIHGGAFHVGSGDGKGPHFLMDKSMVVVTMNYRQGIFGFLSAGNAAIPGNYALKDQVAALKWVKKNIAAFGGDSNAVTILGQSSGSTCVHLHMLSPRSKGLFHRAVMQSGSALSYWSHYDQKHTVRSFRETIKRVNCSRNTMKQMLLCLQQLSADSLIRTEHAFLNEKRIIMKYRPVVEKPQVKTAFLTVSPFKLSYQDTSIPWLIGFNSAEGVIDTALFVKNMKRKKNKDRELNKILPYALHYKYWTKNELISNITAALKQEYFENGVFADKADQKLCDLFSDFVFRMPILYTVKTYPGPKYLYYFDYKSAYNGVLMFNYTKRLGAGHGDEMSHLFLSKFSEKLNDADKLLSDKMINYWTNFIIKGDPNGDGQPHWDPVSSENAEYLHITNDLIGMKTGLLSDKYEFWKSMTLEFTKISV